MQLRTKTLSILLFFALLTFWIFCGVEKTIELPEKGKPALLFSNESQDDLFHTFTQAIDSAKNSIYLVVYSLTDPKITRCLKKKAELGLEVTVECDARGSSAVIRKLGERVHITTRNKGGLLHQKILIIDGCKIYIGSANITEESLRLHNNLVLAFFHEDLAKKIRHEKKSSVPKECEIEGQKLKLYTLPEKGEGSQYLLQLIKNAKTSLKIAMFTWTRPDFADAIIAAKQRGIEVEVYLDRNSANGAGKKVTKRLEEADITLFLSKGPSLLHHKFMYIDDESLVSGSANWTKAAFLQNTDCFFHLQNLNKAQKKKMATILQSLKNECQAI